jgi:gliding motility-associated lipoprotein GldH
LKQKKRMGLIAISLWLTAFSCTTIDLYEKDVAIPQHAWSSGFKPAFTFTIKDTSSPYQLFLILRHTEKYNYTNIYINLYAQQPGADSTRKIQFDLPLANGEYGWLGTGMDDIYEHRIPLTPSGQQFYFRKPGNYTFSVEQIMREDPLKNVLDVGLRIEKKQ